MQSNSAAERFVLAGSSTSPRKATGASAANAGFKRQSTGVIQSSPSQKSLNRARSRTTLKQNSIPVDLDLASEATKNSVSTVSTTIRSPTRQSFSRSQTTPIQFMDELDGSESPTKGRSVYAEKEAGTQRLYDDAIRRKAELNEKQALTKQQEAEAAVAGCTFRPNLYKIHSDADLGSGHHPVRPTTAGEKKLQKRQSVFSPQHQGNKHKTGAKPSLTVQTSGEVWVPKVSHSSSSLNVTEPLQTLTAEDCASPTQNQSLLENDSISTPKDDSASTKPFSSPAPLFKSNSQRLSLLRDRAVKRHSQDVSELLASLASVNVTDVAVMKSVEEEQAQPLSPPARSDSVFSSTSGSVSPSRSSQQLPETVAANEQDVTLSANGCLSSDEILMTPPLILPECERFEKSVFTANVTGAIFRRMAVHTKKEGVKSPLGHAAPLQVFMASGYNGSLQIQHIDSCSHLYVDYEDDESPMNFLFPNRVLRQISSTAVVMVSCGYEHAVLVTAHGRVAAWGNGEMGALGFGDYNSVAVPRIVHLPEESHIVFADCGGYHSGIVTRNGRIYTWGRGDTGQLGLDKTELTADQHGLVALAPKLVSAFQNIRIRAVACGEVHTLFLDDTGRTYSCGWGEYGQLGLGKMGWDHKVFLPAFIPYLRHLVVVRIVTGALFSAALTVDGEVFTWGLGDHGQLGVGQFGCAKFPVEIKSLYSVDDRITDIHCGFASVVTCSESGMMYAWGLGIPSNLQSHSTFRQSSIRKGSMDPTFVRSKPQMVDSLKNTHNLTFTLEVGHRSQHRKAHLQEHSRKNSTYVDHLLTKVDLKVETDQSPDQDVSASPASSGNGTPNGSSDNHRFVRSSSTLSESGFGTRSAAIRRSPTAQGTVGSPNGRERFVTVAL
eukprot:GILK01002863.1.p1 GENE.GILK01002863.1~~GILK01002863.1.p1  ORF type:complete len:889 (-),score=184.57 GILK01002863.1:247-2913(-)